jgi:hypothetical protein
MQTFTEPYELQVDEKPNGAVIRINNAFGCRVRICSIPKELVFDEKGEVRSFIDITYPKKQKTGYEKAQKVVELMRKNSMKHDVAIFIENTDPVNPVILIDKSLDSFNDKVLFPKKVAKANEMLKKVGLPKTKKSNLAQITPIQKKPKNLLQLTKLGERLKKP